VLGKWPGASVHLHDWSAAMLPQLINGTPLPRQVISSISATQQERRFPTNNISDALEAVAFAVRDAELLAHAIPSSRALGYIQIP
jgi:hypothetical protein